jgi:hypothetical protein
MALINVGQAGKNTRSSTITRQNSNTNNTELKFEKVPEAVVNLSEHELNRFPTASLCTHERQGIINFELYISMYAYQLMSLERIKFF